MSAKWTFWAWDQNIKKAPLKLALLQLADNANDAGVSWYSVPKMADRCGMSDRALQGHLKTLQSMGMLEIKERKGTSSLYKLQEVEIVLTPAESSGLPPQNLHPTPAESSDDPNNEPNNEPNSFNNVCELAFETFWSAGMRKVNKKGALKAFIALCKKYKSQNEPDEIAELMAQDVRARIAANQFGFEKMHPATYINGERWTDERLQESNASNHTQGRNTDPVAATRAKLAAREARINKRERQTNVAMGSGGGALPYKVD